MIDSETTPRHPHTVSLIVGMPTSELSDALNPCVVQTRSRTSTTAYSGHLQPVVQPPQQYIPHRSELELAISEPPPPPRTRAQPSAEGIHAVQELLRVVSATREAQEIERKRRLAWEQEQEAKYTQRQAEMERQMFEMRQEISSLRSVGSVNPSMPSGLFIPQFNGSPGIPLQGHLQPASPISPVSQPSSHSQHAFVHGPSNSSFSNQQPYYSEPSNDIQPQQQPEITVVEPPQHSVTPSPSPQPAFVEPSLLQPETSAPPVNARKRQTSELSDDERGESSDSESSASRPERPLKRASHHDKRCLTIHHAMRAHILWLMEVEHDKKLPDSHSESVLLEPQDPVRFVWDKTIKQSVHNARMKARVLADLKSKRRLYKHVPDKDFGKKTLNAAFDQSFTTFRHKFKAQRDELAAMTYKKREDAKTLKARRISRRKVKLTNRADSRLKIDEFDHVTFDGALQVECMSSEESDFEDDSPGLSRPSGILRTRGYSWRSSRLQRFYSTLDDEEKADRSTKPKRGVGKKERCTGPPKDGFQIPPKGVASWMISRRWLNAAQATHPDLTDVLKKIVVDPPGFDWNQFHALGEESEDSDDDHHTTQDLDSQNPQQHYPNSTSSLNYALV